MHVASSCFAHKNQLLFDVVVVVVAEGPYYDEDATTMCFYLFSAWGDSL